MCCFGGSPNPLVATDDSARRDFHILTMNPAYCHALPYNNEHKGLTRHVTDYLHEKGPRLILWYGGLHGPALSHLNPGREGEVPSSSAQHHRLKQRQVPSSSAQHHRLKQRLL